MPSNPLSILFLGVSMCNRFSGLVAIRAEFKLHVHQTHA